MSAIDLSVCSHSRPIASWRAHPREPGPRKISLLDDRPVSLQFHLTRCGTRAPSPGCPRDPDIPGFRPDDTELNLQSCTGALNSGLKMGRPETFPVSVPVCSDIRALRQRLRYT